IGDVVVVPVIPVAVRDIPPDSDPVGAMQANAGIIVLVHNVVVDCHIGDDIVRVRRVSDLDSHDPDPVCGDGTVLVGLVPGDVTVVAVKEWGHAATPTRCQGEVTAPLRVIDLTTQTLP